MAGSVPRFAVALACALLIAAPTAPHAAEWSGRIAAELRLFPQAPADPHQTDGGLALLAEPQYHTEWNGGRDSFTAVPFVRVDTEDSARSHADLREFTWLHVGEDWELRAGVRRLFWGVTESQHLVDIVNQTDFVEDPDGEDKLGQPMINLALIRDAGTFDLYLLPGFRERTFPGRAGRLRSLPRVDTSQTSYADADGDRHLDAAVRWQRVLGDWDIGVSHFAGTSREPRLRPGVDRAGEPVLIPHYDLIDQTGLDLQWTRAAWLWKLEAIRRSGQGPTFFAATAGFEYTLTGVAGSALDLGLLAEYLYDERGARSPAPFQDDVMLGMRLGVNDVQGSELLFAVIADRDGGAAFYNLEASRRVGAQWRLGLVARAFAHPAAHEALASYRDDDYVQLELGFYF